MKKSRIGTELQDEALALHRYLTNYALKMCGNEDLAKDAVQDAYCNFFDGYDAKKQGGGNVRTFLFSKVKMYIIIETGKATLPLDGMEFKIGECDMTFEDMEDIDRAREADEKEDKSNRRKLKKMLEEKVFTSSKKNVNVGLYRQIYPLFIAGKSYTEIRELLGWHCTDDNAKRKIYIMREHVSRKLGVPMRVFTQYQCHMA